MPVLKTYTAPATPYAISGGRRAEGSDLAPELGNVAGQVKKAAEGYIDFAEEDEARKALIASSEIRAEYARKLDEAQLTGSDLGRLKDEMLSKLGKVGEQFQTKRGADSLSLYTSNTELMFDEQANRIAVTRAASQAKLDGAKFLNSESAIIQSNPLYLGVATANADAFVATLKGVTPELRAELSDRIKKELNMAAALGAARIDPEGTKKKLDGGEWDLSPDQRNAAINKADTEIRAKRAEEAYARALKKEEIHDRNEAARDKQFKGIMEGKASRRAIMDDPDLTAATREHLIVFMETRAKALSGEERRSDPATLKDAWSRIARGEIISTGPVVDLVNNNRINTKDGAWLVSLVQAQRDEGGQSFRSRLNARVGVVDRALRARPDAPGLAATGALEQIELEIITRAERQANEYRAKDNKEALDGMLDSESKHYFFTPARMKQIEADVKTSLAPKVPTVKTQAEYDALPPGAQYMDSAGKIGTKSDKGKRTASGTIK